MSFEARKNSLALKDLNDVGSYSIQSLESSGHTYFIMYESGEYQFIPMQANLNSLSDVNISGFVANFTYPVYNTSTSKYEGQVAAVAKSLHIDNPTDSEDVTFFYTRTVLTVVKIQSVVFGSSVAVPYTIKYASDRSAAGTTVVSISANSTTTGNNTTSFTNASIPANQWVWIETTTLTGTPTALSITLFATGVA